MNSNNNRATNFIIKELKSFINSFSKTRVRYEFDNDASVHCVEVVPNQIYHSDNNYIDWENNITDTFIALFPDQNICFFSDDAVVGINNVQFERAGNKYVETISTSDCKSNIYLEQIHISNTPNLLNMDNISSSIKAFNSGIANKVNQGNVVTDRVNRLTSIENQALFYFHYPTAA